MSIRIRTVSGYRVALCAVESDPAAGDIYLDDADHYALAAKFALDWRDFTGLPSYPEHWIAMETQKLRDAKTELLALLAEQDCAEIVGADIDQGGER